MPSLTEDRDGWWQCVDADGNGSLSKREVLNVLVTKFAIDSDKLEAALPELWKRWDTNGDGSISKEEFLQPEVGLAAFVSRYLLKQELPAAACLSSGSSTDASAAASAATGPRSDAAGSAAADLQGARVFLDDEQPLSALEHALRHQPTQWFHCFADRRTQTLKASQAHRGLVKSVLELTPRAALAAMQRTVGQREAAAAVGDFLTCDASAIGLAQWLEGLHVPLLAAIDEEVAKVRECNKQSGIDQRSRTQSI